MWVDLNEQPGLVGQRPRQAIGQAAGHGGLADARLACQQQDAVQR